MPNMRLRPAWLMLASLLLPLLAAAAGEPRYQLHYHAALLPDEGEAAVTLALGQRDQMLRELRFRVDPQRHYGFEGDGRIEHNPPFVHWHPPAEGGEFRLRLVIDRERGNGGYDARITEDWALLRADHLFPAARVRSVVGATAEASLSFELPESWSLESRYGSWRDEPLRVEDPTRRFVRPTGWLVAGALGVRREQILDHDVVVAAPVGVGVRRMDALALIRWTLPTLLEIFPGFPTSLLVVSAGDPMWRGALSGPESLYIHADRPMINERGTSTLLHELVHVAGIVHTGPRAGWIVEGLADYYSLEILRRAGVISEQRHATSLRTLARRGESVRRLDVGSAGGAVTARAVGEFARIDQAIREASDQAHSLDHVARALAESPDTITYARLRAISEELAGRPLDVFDELPLARR
jgi:hypothetical protein